MADEQRTQPHAQSNSYLSGWQGIA